MITAMTRLVCALLLFAPMPAFTCTCAVAMDAPRSLHSRSTIFRGTVIDKKVLPLRPEMRGRGRYAITFRVDRYWQGSSSPTLVLYTVDDGTDCLGGSSYLVGTNYLVFASSEESRDVFLEDYFWVGWVDILPKGTQMLVPETCAPGGESSTVKELIEQLGKGRAPRK